MKARYLECTECSEVKGTSDPMHTGILVLSQEDFNKMLTDDKTVVPTSLSHYFEHVCEKCKLEAKKRRNYDMIDEPSQSYEDSEVVQSVIAPNKKKKK